MSEKKKFRDQEYFEHGLLGDWSGEDPLGQEPRLRIESKPIKVVDHGK